MKTQTVKEKIQSLINQATLENEKQKQKLNFLFRKLDEVKELETLERLKEYENGKFLKAFLLYRSLIRANFQVEHLKLTNFEDGSKYLEAISRDIEEFEKGQTDEPKPPREITNPALLIWLGERIEKGEIRTSWRESGEVCDSLVVEEEGNDIMELNLETGKIEPDPAEEFLKKHSVLSETDQKPLNNSKKM